MPKRVSEALGEGTSEESTSKRQSTSRIDNSKNLELSNKAKTHADKEKSTTSSTDTPKQNEDFLLYAAEAMRTWTIIGLVNQITEAIEKNNKQHWTEQNTRMKANNEQMKRHDELLSEAVGKMAEQCGQMERAEPDTEMDFDDLKTEDHPEWFRRHLQWMMGAQNFMLTYTDWIKAKNDWMTEYLEWTKDYEKWRTKVDKKQYLSELHDRVSETYDRMKEHDISIREAMAQLILFDNKLKQREQWLKERNSTNSAAKMALPVINRLINDLPTHYTRTSDNTKTMQSHLELLRLHNSLKTDHDIAHHNDQLTT